MSVCLSVCPSHAGIVSKRLHIPSEFFSKTVPDRAIYTMVDRIWSIERRHFQWPWTTSTPSFKVTPFFDAERLRNGTRYRHSFNEILILTEQCYCEWFWVSLGDLAKYSVTWSVARSLYDSWASCLITHGPLILRQNGVGAWRDDFMP